MTDSRTYSDEEVEAIFRRALERQVEDGDGFAHDELIAAAREVGLDEASIDRALLEVDSQRSAVAVRERLTKKQREAWLRHFVTYLVVVGGSLAMHGLGFFGAWPIFMAFGWGIGMALHTFGAFRGPSDEAVEKVIVRQNRKARRAAKARERVEAKRRAKAERTRRPKHAPVKGELEHVIEEGVSLLLAAAAKKLREATREIDAPPPGEFGAYVKRQKSAPRESTATSPAREKEPFITTPAPRARVETQEDEEAAELSHSDRRRARAKR